MANTPEELTRINLINPALIQAWWDFETQILEEEVYSHVEIINWKQEKLWKSWRVDYLLCINKNWVKLPIAILEAKKEEEFNSLGLEQAKKYASRFNVPFCFSTNWHLVSSYDYNSNQTIFDFSISDFPSPQKLQNLYEEKKWFSLDEDKSKSLFTPYSTTTNSPRYYQDAAIRATIEKINSKLEGNNRVLLTLATWAWKTTLAVQLIYKLIKSNNAKKILFLCDRSTLSNQAFTDFSKAFWSDVVQFWWWKKYHNAKIIVATYQSLKLEWDEVEESFFAENFGQDYFSHIIIDECHRSAWWRWRYPLDANKKAVHIWLTATPKQIELKEWSEEANEDMQILADNFKYFWEPVYEYTIWQWQSDWYLAQCEIITLSLNIDKEVYTRDEIFALNPINAKTWNPVAYEELKETYEAKHLDKMLIIPKRTKEFAKSFIDYMEKTGWLHQKTIIFCASDLHADYVAAEINNLYREKLDKSEQVKNYAFKFTSNTFLEKWKNKDTQETLKADFETKTNDYIVATTVDLLSTWVDIKPLLNVVFFRHIASPILFYQMVGRWTRLHPESGKFMFRIYDYTNATRLFWKDFKAKWVNKKEMQDWEWETWWTGTPRKPTIKVWENDFINTPSGYDEWTKYMLINEKKVPIQEYMNKLVAWILENVWDLELLRKIWIDKDKRTEFISSLYGWVGSIKKMIELLELPEKENFELYDILKEIVFNSEKFSRTARVEMCKKRFEDKKSPNEEQRQIYEALISQFLTGWIEWLEKKELFEVWAIRERWWIKALSILWNPKEVLQNIKECILMDE